jgi:hypothetical protein
MKLLNHLISNTPMKLLTTIAAVLISISAFSQDYVEYENGTFTQNGEELSMEQIDDLTVLHKAGRGNVRKGNRFDHMYKDGDLRVSNNGLNALGGLASGVPGGLMVLVGGLSGLYSIAVGDSYYALESIIFLVPGAGLSAVSYKAFSRVALLPEACLRKRDKQFNKVADKLNEAIKAANQ